MENEGRGKGEGFARRLGGGLLGMRSGTDGREPVPPRARACFRVARDRRGRGEVVNAGLLGLAKLSEPVAEGARRLPRIVAARGRSDPPPYGGGYQGAA